MSKKILKRYSFGNAPEKKKAIFDGWLSRVQQVDRWTVFINVRKRKRNLFITLSLGKPPRSSPLLCNCTIFAEFKVSEKKRAQEVFYFEKKFF